MGKSTAPNFFTKNGKNITNINKRIKRHVEKFSLAIGASRDTQVACLFDEPVEEISTLFEITPAKKVRSYKLHFSIDIKQMYLNVINFPKNVVNTVKSHRHHIRHAWVFSAAPAFALATFLFIAFPIKITPNISNKYSIYSATPLVLGAEDYRVYAKDARAQRINEVFREYKCPIDNLGEVFVYEADKNNIPWWIVAAISFQESSCGKKTPEPDGVESFNAWGWAVYGSNVQMFDNWRHGIETVSEYMGRRFFSQGITEPCDIMKIYTPPSKGSWCEGVKHFGDIIQHYESPTATNNVAEK